MQAKCGRNKILKDVEERLAFRQKWPMVGTQRASSGLRSCCAPGTGLRASPRTTEPDWQRLRGQGAFRALGAGSCESSVWALLEAAPSLSFSLFRSVFLCALHLFTPHPMSSHWMEVLPLSVLRAPGSWRASLLWSLVAACPSWTTDRSLLQGGLPGKMAPTRGKASSNLTDIPGEMSGFLRPIKAVLVIGTGGFLRI